MSTQPDNKKTTTSISHILSIIFSALGAVGTALQNYMAVVMFLRAFVGATTLSKYLSGVIHAFAIGAGGLCSGMVNYFINIDLLDGFFERMTSNKPTMPLTGWQKFQRNAGVFIFSVTGLLFGLMAFTFSAATPLAALSVAAGVFVAIIMTVQEIETWLQGFENTGLTMTWGKLCGHVIAAGNVLALSLLFTLGLAEFLMAFQVAAFPALMIGFAVAFTFGAFTEFYFYNFFLAKFCHNIESNWEAMKSSQYSWIGFLCIGVNAFVNAALTYSGVGLLTGAFTLAGIGLPPAALITGLAAISAVFAGSASLFLGMDFWIRKQGGKRVVTPSESVEVADSVVIDMPETSSLVPAHAIPGLSIFSGAAKKVVVVNAANDSEALDEQSQPVMVN
jgi:hypothetical protein